MKPPSQVKELYSKAYQVMMRMVRLSCNEVSIVFLQTIAYLRRVLFGRHFTLKRGQLALVREVLGDISP